MKIASIERMRDIERMAAAKLGVGTDYFLDRAGSALAERTERYLTGQRDGYALFFCGPGLNGADGVVAARMLRKKGVDARIVTIGGPRRNELTARELAAFSSAGGVAVAFEDHPDEAARLAEARGCYVVVDALFGIGMDAFRQPGESVAQAVTLINRCEKAILAVDIPSGVDPDTGKTWEVFVRADETLTFGLPKPAHFLACSRDFCGRLDIADIGIPESVLEESGIPFAAFEPKDLARFIKPRRQDTHKGDYGRLLIVAGSLGYAGAAALAARAALRTGVGTLTLCVPESIYQVVAAKLDEAMVVPLPADEYGRFSAAALPQILNLMLRYDATLMGCGFGRGGDVAEIILAAVTNAKNPLILDADGLNALSANINVLKGGHGQVILTPHMAEFKRLFGEDYANASENDADALMRLAETYNCTIVLKGHRTIFADKFGAFLNLSGNAGMAKGGSGDALAGVIASLAAQGFEPLDAAACGVMLHGLAGDYAAEKLGQYGMLPSDLIEQLPLVLKSAEQQNK